MPNYKIITRKNKDFFEAQAELTNAVMYSIQFGWIPQGGVSITLEASNESEVPTFYFAQAMVTQ